MQDDAPFRPASAGGSATGSATGAAPSDAAADATLPDAAADASPPDAAADAALPDAAADAALPDAAADAALPDAAADAAMPDPVAPGAPPAPGTAPGMALARGVCRFLVDRGFAPVAEFSPARGLRCDVLALGPKGEVWVVECKSGLPDFRSDAKWEGYLEWCDRFFFAVDPDFPAEALPEDHGLIRADAWGAEIERLPEARPLAAARRRALSLRFARGAALRLRGALDPGAAGFAPGRDAG